MSDNNSATKVIDAILRAGPQQLMRENGFRKTKRSFCRQENGIYQIVGFYASPHCTHDSGDFTADVRLTTPEFHRIWRGTDFPKNPSSADGCIEVGLGRLRDNSELWWQVEQDLPTSEIERIANEVCDVIAQHALPYLQSFTTIGDLLIEIQTHSDRCIGVAVWLQVVQAILLHIDGNKSEAAEMITRSWKRESDPGRKHGLETCAKRMGVPL